MQHKRGNDLGTCPTCRTPLREETPSECAGRKGFALGAYCPTCLETIFDERREVVSQRAVLAIQAAFRKAVEKGVTFAPQDLISGLQPEVDKVLTALGFPGALVTDESTLSDFLSTVLDDEALEMLGRVDEALGFAVSEEDYIWQLAARLRPPT